MTGLDDRHEAAAAAGTTRRSVLRGAGALGAAGLLAACGDDAGPSTSAPPPPPAPPQPIKAADVPVGGGTIFRDQNIVVTQPAAGEFKAFTATCTHMNCQVTDVSQAKIICACHGSQYNIADGSVARGPSTRALPEKTITVSGDTLTVS
jgi:Rieske Fe-S protein